MDQLTIFLKLFDFRENHVCGKICGLLPNLIVSSSKIFCCIYGIKFEDLMLPFYFHFEISFDGARSFAMQNKFIGDHEP